jgi:methyl-accepting chemotaxis protein
MRINFRDLRTTHTAEDIKKVEDAVNALKTNLNKEIETSSLLSNSPEETDKWNIFKKDANDYGDIVINVLQLKKEGKTEEAEAGIAAGGGIGSQITIVLKDITDIIIRDAQTATDYNTDTANATITVMIIIIVIGVIISMILAFYISTIISKPLHQMELSADHIAKTGDLTTKAEISIKDEIGHLNNSVTQMVENFRTLIKQIIGQIDKLNQESVDLSGVSETTATATAELQAQTQTASSSSEEVSANVSTVASAVEELSASIKEISKNTTAATTLTKASEERAGAASEVMNRLGQSSQEIGDIVKSITDIAEQTNLLALNATIEAARAGEMGKGFAVVATEVKELAKQSSKATEDITHKITAIQTDTKSAIEVIEGIIENIGKINEITTAIAAAVEEQSVTANEVNRNLGEATIGVNSVVQVISGMVEAVSDCSKQAIRIKVSSESLQTLATDIDKEIKENFTV